MSVTAEELEIIVRGNVQDAINKLEQLRSKMNEQLTKVNQKIQPSMQQASKAVSDYASNSVSKMSIINREIDLQQQKVKSLQKEMKKYNGYQSAKKQIASGKLDAQQYMEQYNKALKLKESKNVSEQLGKAQLQLDKLKLRAQNTAESMNKTLKPAIEKTSNQIGQKMAESTTKASSGLSKLAKRFKTLISVMIIRKIIQSAIQGFQDLAKYSSTFNKSMSEMKSSTLYLRNSLSSAIAPIIESIAPTIVKIADAIANAVNTLAMWNTALFTNSKTYVRAKKSATNYAEAVSKVKNQLAGFDELNVLNEQDGTGIQAGDMFETFNIPDEVIEKAGKLKEIWETLKPILLALGGALVAGKIANDIEKIGEWINKLTGAKNATKGLTNAMKDKNSVLGDQTEETIAEKIALKNLVPSLLGAGAGVWALSKAFQNLDFTPALEQLGLGKQLVPEFAKEINTASESVKNAVKGMEIGTELALENMNKEFKNSTVSVSDSLTELNNNTQENSKSIKENVLKNFRSIGSGIFLYVANGVYKASKSFADFVSTTSKSTVSWGENIVRNVGETMKGWYENFVSALADAWEQWVSFCEATGNAISKWFNANKSWVIPVTIGLTAVAGIALAPVTGGLSLLPALATGGVLTKDTIFRGGEYAGASQNPEIVSPQSLMYETNIKANIPVMNAIEDMSDRVVEALQGLGVYAEFDYSKLRVGLNNANKVAGNKLYGGAY